MSWHCSQALVEDFSAQGCLGGELYAQLKSIRTVERSFFDDKRRGRSTRALSGMMSEASTADSGVDRWISSLRGSHASHSVSPARSKGKTTAATCGQIQSESFAKWDHDTACWRTFQVSLLTTTTEPFSGSWPKAGILHDGECYRLLSAERRISVIGCGLLPKPNVPNGGRSTKHAVRRGKTLYDPKTGKKVQEGLESAVRTWPTIRSTDGDRGGRGDLIQAVRGNENSHFKTWPTPQARDWKSGDASAETLAKNSRPLNEAVKHWPTPTKGDASGSGGRNGKNSKAHKGVSLTDAAVYGGDSGAKHTGGQLNPTWVEWLMGWPLGWTGLEPLETDKYRQWLEQHGCCLEATD